MISLSSYQKEHQLVSIRRADVDSNAIRAFILGVSERLALLQYVYDFKLDGLLVVRREDISDVQRTATDKFQQSLLAEEGVDREVPFGLQLPLGDWRSVVTHLGGQYPLMILESELGPAPQFVIGRLLKATETRVEVQSFTGAGRWSANPVRLKYAHLTSLQVNTNYANVYQRHFERIAA